MNMILFLTGIYAMFNGFIILGLILIFVSLTQDFDHRVKQ